MELCLKKSLNLCRVPLMVIVSAFSYVCSTCATTLFFAQQHVQLPISLHSLCIGSILSYRFWSF